MESNEGERMKAMRETDILLSDYLEIDIRKIKDAGIFDPVINREKEIDYNIVQCHKHTRQG